MMASMFSAGAALLLVAMATPQTATVESRDERILQQIRTAAAQTAHIDAQAYLEQERRMHKVAFVWTSTERTRTPGDARSEPFSAR